MILHLPSGLSVRPRPVRPDDKALLSAALAQLSDESVRRRFLAPKPRFSNSELRYLTEVDGRDHVALLAELADDPGRIAGVARFVRLADDPSAAEAAITVGDCFQGQGLGSVLGEMLADEARARGIRTFTATMLGDNLPAHRLMRRISSRLVEGPHSGGQQELVAQLAA